MLPRKQNDKTSPQITLKVILQDQQSLRHGDLDAIALGLACVAENKLYFITV